LYIRSQYIYLPIDPLLEEFRTEVVKSGHEIWIKIPDVNENVSLLILLQAEVKVAEYNKLGRKLKLIPQSAENACGHDFEIRTDYSATTITQYKTQIQVQSLLPFI